MKPINIDLVIRIVGIMAFLFIIYSLWMGKMTAAGLPDGYSNPVLALELVKDQKDITTIVGAEDGKVRDFLRRSTYKDFGFIAIYALFFACLGLLLSRLDFSWAKSVGYLAATCAVVGAVMDLVEDRGMLKAIAGEASDALANSIRYPSLAKWALLFIFSLLVGALLIPCRRFLLVSASLFIAAGGLGLVGVLLNLLKPKFYWTFPVAFIPTGIATIIIAILFIFWPGQLSIRLIR